MSVQSDSAVNELVLKLSPKAQRFVHLYVTGQYSNQKIAELLDVHPNTVHNWMKNANVKEAIQDMQSTNHEMIAIRMKAMTNKAIERMAELMDSPIDGVALQAVKDILDRTGHKQKTEIKVDKTVRTFEQKMADIIDMTISDEYTEYEEVEE